MRNLWAYAYEIVPPQPSTRLGAIRAILEDAAAAARAGARTWAGRLVLEQGATHILIVSDSPGRSLSIDHRLEAELARLDARFSVTGSLAVAGPVEGVEGVATYDGNGHPRS
jgi:hypothetical protein